MFFRFFFLSLLFIFAIYWFHIRLCPEDAIAYENLLQESIDLRTRRALEEKPAHQKRQDVQKDIWTQNETRHFQIQSKDSDLTLSQKKEKLEAVEELKNIHCSVENEFTLIADEGIYTYPSHQFIAQENCHLIQNQNQIDGTRIHLDLIQEIVTYENPKGRLGSGPLYFTAKTLIWDKKANQLHLIDEVHIDQPDRFNLVANFGTVDLEELQPSLVTLEGNVRLISSRIQDKESYAVADTLIYNPLEKTLLFTAINGGGKKATICASEAKPQQADCRLFTAPVNNHRVLFWQEGLSLSASEVLIRQNQTVEGHGDVHFAFDLDEQNYIDELFKQYL